MTGKEEIYRCNICGNIVEVLHDGNGKLECCENPMLLLEEKEEGMGAEKHVPILEETDDVVKVKVGSMPHPMEEKHCIEWVEVIADGKVYRKAFKPDEVPEAEFNVKPQDVSQVLVREYCSIHGLWRS